MDKPRKIIYLKIFYNKINADKNFPDYGMCVYAYIYIHTLCCKKSMFMIVTISLLYDGTKH